MWLYNIFTRFFIAICFVFFHLLPGFANRTSDSLSLVLKSALGDTSKVRLLAALAYELASSVPDDAIIYARQAIDLSYKLNFTEGIALAYHRLAVSHKQLTHYDSAFYYFFLSSDIYKKLQHSEGEATALMNIGTLHDRTGSYDSAAWYLFKSLHLSESISKADLKGSVLNNLSLVLRKQGKTDDAIAYNLKALDIHRASDNKKSIAIVSENLGICYMEKKNFNVSEKYFSNALETYAELEDKRGLGRVNINISALLQEQGRLQEAATCALKAVEWYKQIKNPNGEASAYSALAEINMRLKYYSSAADYSLKSLSIAIQTGNRLNEFENYNLLHKIYSLQKDYKKAYEYLDKASSLNDSLFSEKKEEIISELQTKYETEKKEKEIQLLNKDNEIKSLAIKRQAAIRNSLMGGTILLIIIALLLFNRYRFSQRQKHQAERVRISSDLHDEIGSTLSSISMYSAYAKEKPAEAGIILEEISSTSQEMIDDMNDIIWAINPRNDSFRHISDRLRNYASRMAQSKKIILDFRNDDLLQDVVLSMDQRKNIFLICKEAINNAVKYSDCKSLAVKFEKIRKHFTVEVSDDGNGFDTHNSYEGNGLKSMKQRADQVGANFSVQSSKASGTKVNLEMRLM